jgi:glyoxylase-like metal-dependent hydrolase (beta-lactamase superfamily II)
MKEGIGNRIGSLMKVLALWLLFITGQPECATAADTQAGKAARMVSPSVQQRIDLATGLCLRKIGNGAYEICHLAPWWCNSVLVEMSDGTLVMAGTPCTPEATKLVLAWSEKELGKRKVVAINTGYHVDNLGGNQALIDAGIPVYGSDLTAKLLKERGEQTRLTTLKLIADTNSPYCQIYAQMAFAPPDHLFPIRDGATLTFGGEAVRVFFPGPTQAPDKVAVYFPDRKLLFGGCMILAGDRPGNTAEADMKEWPVAIRRLEQFPVNVVVPGHGERMDAGLIRHTLDLLEKK